MQREIPQAGQFYRHFKNKLYQIITVASHTETGEMLVIYQALYGDFKTYARPLEMFLSPVDKEKYPQATQNWRFQRVSFSAAKTDTPAVSDIPADKPDTPAMSDIPADKPAAAPSTPKTTPYLERMEQIVTSFMDADSYEKKLSILENYKDFCDNHILDSMAFILDHSLEGRNTEEKFDELKYILRTLIRFENSRLR